MSLSKQHIPQLYFTRFIAAMAVVIFHHGLLSTPFSKGILHTLFGNGGLAVSYFFALSGFIMCIAYYDLNNTIEINKKQFWQARFARIYPIYLLALILVLVSMIMLKNIFPTTTSFILQILCLQAWKPGESLTINYVGWSLSVEAFFYLLFPFIINYWKNKSSKTIAIQTTVIWLLALIEQYIMVKYVSNPNRFNVGQFIAFFPLWHLNTFIVGMAVSILFKRHWQHLKNSNIVSCVLIITGIIALYIIFIIYPEKIGFYTNGGLAPVFLMIILGLSIHQSWVTKVLSNKYLIWLGDISYGIYLLQWFVFMWVDYFISKTNFKQGLSTKFYSYSLCLIIVSGITFQWVEKPLRKYLKNRFYR